MPREIEKLLDVQRKLNKLRDCLTATKGILTADVPGLSLTREDLQGEMAVMAPGNLAHVRNRIGHQKGVIKGGPGSGRHPEGKSQYIFDPKDPKWVERGTHPFAIKMKDGTIYAHPDAKYHADVIERLGLNPNHVADGGFIINGKYEGGQSDSVRRLIAQKESDVKFMKSLYPDWEPSKETLSEALPRHKPATPAPDTRTGAASSKKAAKQAKTKGKDAVYGQKHQEPIKNPHRTPPAGMGMVSDGFRVAPYYDADNQGTMVTDIRI